MLLDTGDVFVCEVDEDRFCREGGRSAYPREPRISSHVSVLGPAFPFPLQSQQRFRGLSDFVPLSLFVRASG